MSDRPADQKGLLHGWVTSLAVQSGGNVKTIQRMLGRTSAAMTLDVYPNLFDAHLNAVSDRLDAGAAAAGIKDLFI